MKALNETHRFSSEDYVFVPHYERGDHTGIGGYLLAKVVLRKSSGYLVRYVDDNRVVLNDVLPDFFHENDILPVDEIDAEIEKLRHEQIRLDAANSMTTKGVYKKI